ncbi:MAG: DUF3078 domain-containing protein [Candidatus Marinimicrobia bacterium]|nr:DUF3078 domain-containing protein [Candidatus Neomarinimicrobiota bacterium]
MWVSVPGRSVEKTDDRIDLFSNFGYDIADEWDYSTTLGFKTQMMAGYDKDTTLISAFAAPAYLQISTGLTYKPEDSFNLTIAPLSGKITVVADPALSAQGAYGVTPGKNYRPEFGAFIKIAFRKELIENVLLQTKCELFSNYLKSFRDIDVSWDLLISMKINKHLSASINTQLLYDSDYSDRLQFKETVGLGISFTF